jgi:hypothetical protein
MKIKTLLIVGGLATLGLAGCVQDQYGYGSGYGRSGYYSGYDRDHYGYGWNGPRVGWRGDNWRNNDGRRW